MYSQFHPWTQFSSFINIYKHDHFMCVVNLVYEHNVFHAWYNSFVMEMPSKQVISLMWSRFCSFYLCDRFSLGTISHAFGIISYWNYYLGLVSSLLPDFIFSTICFLLFDSLLWPFALSLLITFPLQNFLHVPSQSGPFYVHI